MQNNDVIEILNRIRVLIKYEKYFEVQEYINLEINNLLGETAKNCQKTKYRFNYCNMCTNKNCTENTNNIDKKI